MKKDYIGTIAILFTDAAKTTEKKPFKKTSIRKSHILFSKIAEKHNLKVLFANHKEYSRGRLKKAWIHTDRWKIINNQEIDIVYSRFAGSIYRDNEKNKDAERFKYNMAKEVTVLNHPSLDEFCWDKMLISDVFPKHTPKTFLVNTLKGLRIVLPSIKTKKYIIKPRYGTLGRDIKIYKKNKLPKKVEKNTLVQELVDTTHGIFRITKKVHDLRIIVINGEIDHAFVRIPRKHILIANVSLGARKKFINKKDIPESAKKIVKKVDCYLKKFTPRLYSVDFIFDEKGRPFIVECNSQPMIDKYAYGKYADPSYYERICKLLRSNIKIKVKNEIR